MLLNKLLAACERKFNLSQLDYKMLSLNLYAHIVRQVMRQCPLPIQIDAFYFTPIVNNSCPPESMGGSISRLLRNSN